MAKTAKPKASTSSKSVRSRAARRAASPSLDLDKSVTSLPRPEETNVTTPSVLAARQNAGISKKTKSKRLSRAQRLRQEKGLERAEIVMDKTEKKVVKSVAKGKNVKARRAPWEEIDGKAAGQDKLHARDQDLDAMDMNESNATPEQPASSKFTPTAAPQATAAEPQYDFEADGEIT